MRNSIATCGSGTTGCHGKLQRNELLPSTMNANNKDLRFFPNPNLTRRE